MGLPASKFGKKQNDQVQVVEKKKPVTSSEQTWGGRKLQTTLSHAVSFVPWVIQQALQEGTLSSDVVVHSCQGAVVFSDASGFTKLTETLAQFSNGAELLSASLTKFFTPLIDLINAYRGDVIKFSGDALTVLFPAVDDYSVMQFPCGSGWAEPPPKHSAMSLAVLRASACCIEIHKKLTNFSPGVEGVYLSLHIGVGAGSCKILQVGGVVPPDTTVPRYEYVIAGPPLEQISVAEPLASIGETVLSPQAWKFVESYVIEGDKIQERPDFRRLAALDVSKHTYATVKVAATAADRRRQYLLPMKELKVTRRYIQTSVYKHIENGTMAYVNEMRAVSIIFIQVQGVDVSTETGALKGQELMSKVQRACYDHEGVLNKFLVDDKGLLLLLVFGLPPLVHTDDPLRAVLACLDMVDIIQGLGLIARFGVTTGKVYCGLCGSATRQEYTVLGDSVNLSARLMANAQANSVLVDSSISSRPTEEVEFETLTPIKVKGKEALIKIFRPRKVAKNFDTGLSLTRDIKLPWQPTSTLFGGESPLTELTPSGSRTSDRGYYELGLMNAFLGVDGAKAELPHGTTPGLFTDRSGALILQGKRGVGKRELGEYVLHRAVQQHHMLPCYMTTSGRPGLDAARQPVLELIHTAVQGFRHVQSYPQDIAKALSAILPDKGDLIKDVLPLFNDPAPSNAGNGKKNALDRSSSKTDPAAVQRVEQASIDLAAALVEQLVKHRPVIVLMRTTRGTAHSAVDASTFWSLTDRLTDLVQTTTQHKMVLLLLTREVPAAPMKVPRIIEFAQSNGWIVTCKTLNPATTRDYMSKRLQTQTDLQPDLPQYVHSVSLGTPKYILETLDQFLANNYIAVSGTDRKVQLQTNLDTIAIADWTHTSMVGDVLCEIEALDPQEQSIVKMATVFQGAFSVADLAASSKSPWAGAYYLDNLRLYKACNVLTKREMLREEKSSHMDNKSGSFQAVHEDTPMFILDNVLVRRVAGTMLLEQQKMAVKRAALMQRMLNKELPARLQEKHRRDKELHVPYWILTDLG